MKKIAVSFLAFFAVVASQAQVASYDRNLAVADSLWLVKQPQKSLRLYEAVLQDASFPSDMRALVLMRLAKAGKAAGDKNTYKSSVERLYGLPYLPEHYKLELKESQQTAVKRTLQPQFKEVALSVYVGNDLQQEKIPAGALKCKTIAEAISLLKSNAGKPKTPGAIEIVLCDKSLLFSSQPIRLDARCSGTERNPVVFRGLKAGSGLSGGISFSGWKKETDETVLKQIPQKLHSKLYVCDYSGETVPPIPAFVFGGFSSQRAKGTDSRFKTFPVCELFYHGQRQMLSRFPNDRDTVLDLANMSSDRALRWRGEKDLWLHGYWKYLWADAYEKVQSISEDGKKIELEPPFNRYGFAAKYKWHVVNALSEIDTPGEWCLDAAGKKIWFCAPDAFRPDDCRLSTCSPIIEAENCNYLYFDNLEFNFINGDALVFKNCSNLGVMNCRIKNASGYGIKIYGGTHHLLHSCSISQMGRGGIDIMAGDRRLLKPAQSVIENCTIESLSHIDRTYTPAILLEGVGITVRNNKFSHIPSSAIRLEGNDMLIELNEFAFCVHESEDQGAIDVWGNPTYRGNVIRWNYFHHIGRPQMEIAAGVRLDDAVCGFTIAENIFVKSAGGAFGAVQIHGGKDNFVDGNLIILCKNMLSCTPWGLAYWNELCRTHKAIRASLDDPAWKTPLWQQKYPLLSRLTDSIPDRNFFSDNLGINCEKKHLRFSKSSVVVNDQVKNNRIIGRLEEKIRLLPDSAQNYLRIIPFREIMLPWHTIPYQSIGNY